MIFYCHCVQQPGKADSTDHRYTLIFFNKLKTLCWEELSLQSTMNVQAFAFSSVLRQVFRVMVAKCCNNDPKLWTDRSECGILNCFLGPVRWLFSAGAVSWLGSFGCESCSINMINEFQLFIICQQSHKKILVGSDFVVGEHRMRSGIDTIDVIRILLRHSG